MFSSVRSRLTVWYAAVLSCSLLLLSLVIYFIVKESVLARMDASLVELSDSFLATLEAELSDAPAAEGITGAARQSMLEHQYPGHSFAVLTTSGDIVAVSSDLPSAAPQSHADPSPEISPRALQTCLASLDAPPRFFRALPAKRGGVRCYTRTFSAAGHSYRLVILASLHPESELLENIRIALAWLIPFTIVLASAGGYFLARKSLAPVADMTARADRISEFTIHDRLPIQSPRDELGRLAATFNRLLDRLDAAFERQRRFIADASHELRTPLAILQGESEVALSKDVRSTEEYRESLGILHHEARRLTRVVDDMFTLSRADAGQYPVAFREFYLDELASDCVQSLRSLAAAKSIALSTNSAGELPIVADESLVRRMLLNLLDNSIKYTPSGGTVSITTHATPDHAEISVANNGPGIPEELQPRLFERFFRADQARTRSNSDGGAGLGLAISKWIAQAHHGSLELTRSGPAGTVFTARLPISASSPTRID
jgi:two-component system, OmpR family, sensor kinase